MAQHHDQPRAQVLGRVLQAGDADRVGHIAGHAHPERRFDEAALRDAQSAADLVGYLNYIHPYRVQLVGRREVAYLSEGSDDVLERRVSRIVTLEPPVIIVADDCPAPPKLVAMCDRADIPLFTTAAYAGHVIDVIRAHLAQLCANRSTRHGVFMDILGMGVLLTGESGLGKSELGLELISRGHGLVADDAVDFFRIAQDKMRLKLIVHLVRRETLEREFERLPYEPLYEELLGVPTRKVIIAVDAGRNLAVLVEAAVRNTILQLRGIDTYQEFVARHQRAMEHGSDEL